MSDEMPRFNWGEPDEFGTRPPPEKYLKPSALTGVNLVQGSNRPVMVALASLRLLDLPINETSFEEIDSKIGTVELSEGFRVRSFDDIKNVCKIGGFEISMCNNVYTAHMPLEWVELLKRRESLPVGEVCSILPRQALNESFATLYYGAVAEFVKIEETDTEVQMILKVVANLERLNGALRKNAEAHRKQLDRLAKYDNFLDAAGSILAELNNREW